MWPNANHNRLWSANHFSHLPESQVRFFLCWTLLNEVWAKHILYAVVACWQYWNVSLFTVLKRIVMTLIALSGGSQGMPLLAKHPVALFKYTTVCSVCEKHRKCTLGPSTFVKLEWRPTSWTLNTLKGSNMLVGKLMVIAFSALFETRATLFGLDVSLIMTMIT